MSTKKENPGSDLSPAIGDNFAKTPMVSLNAQGQEVPNPLSLVTVANARPVTMGERIRTYIRHGTLQQANMDALYDAEDIDSIPLDDDTPLSVYEDRAAYYRQLVIDQYNADEKAKKDALIQAEAEENERFRQRYEELQFKASIPPAPPSENAV